MSNLSNKPSASTNLVSPVAPVTTEKVVANFNLATSQLLELLVDCNDSSKKGAELMRKMNGIEDRLTVIERKLNQQEASNVTTSDLGKAMCSLKEGFTKETLEIRTEMRETREAIIRETFQQTNAFDLLQAELKKILKLTIQGVVNALTQIESKLDFNIDTDHKSNL